MLIAVMVILVWGRELYRLQNSPEKAKNKAKNQMQSQEANILRLALPDNQANEEEIQESMQKHLSSS